MVLLYRPHMYAKSTPFGLLLEVLGIFYILLEARYVRGFEKASFGARVGLLVLVRFRSGGSVTAGGTCREEGFGDTSDDSRLHVLLQACMWEFPETGTPNRPNILWSVL